MSFTGIMVKFLGGLIARVDNMITGNSKFKTRVERELRKDTGQVKLKSEKNRTQAPVEKVGSTWQIRS